MYADIYIYIYIYIIIYILHIISYNYRYQISCVQMPFHKNSQDVASLFVATIWLLFQRVFFPMENETRQLSDIRDYFPISYNLNFLSRNVLYSFFFVLAKINLLHYSLKFLFIFFFFFNSELTNKHKKTSSLSDFAFFRTLKLTKENKKILLPPTFAKNWSNKEKQHFKKNWEKHPTCAKNLKMSTDSFWI